MDKRTVILVVIALALGIGIGAIFFSTNVYTVEVGNEVKTSEGVSFPLTTQGINDAIDSLGCGTVFVGGPVDITEPITPNREVSTDFMNNKMTMVADCEFILIDGFVEYAEVKNVIVEVTDGHTADVIHLLISPGNAHWSGRIRHNLFYNIHIINPSDYSLNHDYTGIHLEMNDNNNMLKNIFEKIVVRWCDTGIKFTKSADATNGWGNGNVFRDIYIDRFVNMIWFNVDNFAGGQNGFNANIFDNIKSQTPGEGTNYESDAIYGVRGLSGNRNWFDKILIWDWHVVEPDEQGNGVYEWEITSDAQHTKIDAHYYSDYIVDLGYKTTFNEGCEPFDDSWIEEFN